MGSIFEEMDCLFENFRWPLAQRRCEGGIEMARHGYRATIEAIRAIGKRVVIVAPPFKTGFDIGRCLGARSDWAILFWRRPRRLFVCRKCVSGETIRGVVATGRRGQDNPLG